MHDVNGSGVRVGREDECRVEASVRQRERKG